MFVDAVAEPCKAEGMGPILGQIDIFPHIVSVGMNGFEHLHHLLIRTAMSSPRRIDAGRHGSKEIRMRRSDETYRGR